MCGILIYFSKGNICIKKIDYSSLKNRGPDHNKTIVHSNTQFTFYRLKINDMSEDGNQPFYKNGVFLLCNGEIYNYNNLQNYVKTPLQSQSDCEIIIDLYLEYGIEKTLKLLDGVFAFCLYDSIKGVYYAARDPIGVRPLYYSIDTLKNTFGICSTATPLQELGLNSIRQLPASSYMMIEKGAYSFVTYNRIPQSPSIYSFNMESACSTIRKLLFSAVEKRLLCERPMGCLLSGGLDSSIVTYILSMLLENIDTFSIGFNNSIDVKYSKLVSDHLKTTHHIYTIDEKEALTVIPEVIKQIESYDITTVRASIGMYLLGKYIKKKHKNTVIFSGEGADELFCGYLYFHNAPSPTELYNESKRLVEELPLFDVLRADRCISSNGLELRVPFLDKHLVNYALSLPGKDRMVIKGYEKYILRKAFEYDLPKEVVWRRKDGFSDGVGDIKEPFYKKIQKFVETKISDECLKICKTFQKELFLPKIITKESLYYYFIYSKLFPKLERIPHYWMPRWSNQKDPSGREIKAYDEESKKKE